MGRRRISLMGLKEFDVDEVPRDLVIQMLKYEDRLRKSPEMQALYDRCNHVAGDQVERFIQRNVLKRHGFTPSVENLAEFWKIRAKYGDDDREVMESVIYLRYAHLLHECTIPLGAAAPDATLVTMDQKPCRLPDYMQQHDKLVILAGSMT